MAGTSLFDRLSIYIFWKNPNFTGFFTFSVIVNGIYFS